MKSSIYTFYNQNQNKLGFWIKKNNWKNYIARIVKIKGHDEGEEIQNRKDEGVIAFILDIRTNELEECVELINANDPNFIHVEREIEPKNSLPQAITLMHGINKFNN